MSYETWQDQCIVSLKTPDIFGSFSYVHLWIYLDQSESEFLKLLLQTSRRIIWASGASAKV